MPLAPATRGEDECGRTVLALHASNAPTDASEQALYEHARAWRAFDRDPRTYVALEHGRKRGTLAPVE